MNTHIKKKKKKKALLRKKTTLSKRDFICHSLCLSKTNKRISLWKQVSRTNNLHNQLFSSSTCLFLYKKSLCVWQCTRSCSNALGENHDSARLSPTSLPSLTGAQQSLCQRMELRLPAPPGRVNTVPASHCTTHMACKGLCTPPCQVICLLEGLKFRPFEGLLNLTVFFFQAAL